MINRNLFLPRPRRVSARHALVVGLLATATISAPLALLASDRVVNVTTSLADRVIKVVPIEQAQRGDYVSFCRPLPLGNIPKGNCPDGTAPLVKRVIGIAGDTVTWTPTEVRVEAPSGWYQIHEMRHVHAGTDVPLDQRYPHPGYGGRAVLDEGQVIVQGDHPMSVDSRYFGAINTPSRPWPVMHIPAMPVEAAGDAR